MPNYLIGAGGAVVLGGTFGALAVFPFWARNQANQNKWFTIVPEGFGRAILNNGQFHGLYMSLTDHDFRGSVSDEQIKAAKKQRDDLEMEIDPEQRELDRNKKEIAKIYKRIAKIEEIQKHLDQAREDKRQDDIARHERDLGSEIDGRPAADTQAYILELREDIARRESECRAMDEKLMPKKREYANFVVPHPWDIVPSQENSQPGFLAEWYPFGLMRGMHLVGIPGFYQVHTYHFKWMTWELARDTDGKMKKMEIHHEEKEMQHILLRDDVYYVKVYSAETIDGIPVDMSMLLTIRIMNPYKALFEVEQWLEATTNRIEADAVQYIGSKSFDDIYSMGETAPSDAADTMNNELELGLWRQISFCRNEYGAWIRSVQIINVDPADDRGRNFRELLLRSTIEEREGNARIIKETKDAEALRKKTDGQTYQIREFAAAREDELNRTVIKVARTPGADRIYPAHVLSRPDSPIRTLGNLGGGQGMMIAAMTDATEPQPPKPGTGAVNEPTGLTTGQVEAQPVNDPPVSKDERTAQGGKGKKGPFRGNKKKT